MTRGGVHAHMRQLAAPASETAWGPLAAPTERARPPSGSSSMRGPDGLPLRHPILLPRRRRRCFRSMLLLPRLLQPLPLGQLLPDLPRGATGAHHSAPQPTLAPPASQKRSANVGLGASREVEHAASLCRLTQQLATVGRLPRSSFTRRVQSLAMCTGGGGQIDWRAAAHSLSGVRCIADTHVACTRASC